MRAVRAALLSIGLLPGCGTLPHDRSWGADADIAPGWAHAASSARRAALDARVWAPLAAAAALQIDGWDREASDWAREHAPVFGSPAAARRRSDEWRDAADYAWLASAVVAESGDAWIVNKARGLAVGAAAVTANSALTGAMKSGFARERPNGYDRRSLPSGHASGAAVRAALASRHLEFAPVRPAARTALDLGLDAITLGTAWARVEAGVHYPSDVLCGMALGRFLGTWFNDAFLDPRRPGAQWTVLIYPRADL